MTWPEIRALVIRSWAAEGRGHFCGWRIIEIETWFPFTGARNSPLQGASLGSSEETFHRLSYLWPLIGFGHLLIPIMGLILLPSMILVHPLKPLNKMSSCTNRFKKSLTLIIIQLHSALIYCQECTVLPFLPFSGRGSSAYATIIATENFLLPP